MAAFNGVGVGVGVGVILVSVAVSASAFDGCGRLWDLRSGKCIMLMDGHLKGVVAVDFAPSGWVPITS